MSQGELSVVIPTQGGEVVVTKSDIKNYLCPKATDSEIFMFLQMCKTQRLNPFIKEAYIVKYDDNKPANMVVSKDAFMKRAESHPAYDGFRAGVVVHDKSGALVEREGTLVVDGEMLVGGWAEVFRKDRRLPTKTVVSLKEFNKNQATWNLMRGTMIRKCAVVNAMREAFPKDVGSLYIEDEMVHPDKDIAPAYAIPEILLNEIKSLAQQAGVNEAKLNMLMGQYKGKEQDLATHLKGLIPVETKEAVVDDAVENNTAAVDTRGATSADDVPPEMTTQEVICEMPSEAKKAKKHPTRTDEPERAELMGSIAEMKVKLPPDAYQIIRKKYPASVMNITTKQLMTLKKELENAMIAEEVEK